MVKRGEVWLVSLDPTVGSEIRKTRPCLVVSPGELTYRNVFVAPLTTGAWSARFRIPVTFAGREALILADQLRTVSQLRLQRRLGVVDDDALTKTLAVLREMFAE